MGNGSDVQTDWFARLAAARYARAISVTLLAAAAAGQAIAQAVTLGEGTAPGESAAFSSTLATEYILPLSLLALLATVPLAVYRPVMAAIAVTFGNAVALASFGQVTAAGGIAELVAACWLGLAGGPDSTGVFRRLGGGWHGPGAMAGRYLAVGLGLPFLGLALAGGGWVAVLLAAAIPVAGGAGIAVWAGRLARTRTMAGEILADTLMAHTARGERARIARELHDVVAHHISMIAVLAETGRLATPGMPEAGARRFLEIGDTARAGLTEMRRLLGVLREDAADAPPGAASDAGDGRPSRVAATSATHSRGGPAAAADELAAGGGPLAESGGRPAEVSGGRLAERGRLAESGGARASRQPQPGLAQLTQLIDAAREASLTGTRLIISGPVAPLDPGVELAAYRIVQEALTNARRHAPGAAVDVELRYGPESLRVRIRDNGPGPVTAPEVPGLAAGGRESGGSGDWLDAIPVPAGSRPQEEQTAVQQAGGGHGLLGMRERAFAVGGALYVGAAPGGGFLVEAVLPSEPDPFRASHGTTAASTGAAPLAPESATRTGGER